MSIRLGSKRAGIIVNGRPFAKKTWSVNDTLAYIDGKTGSYDDVEHMCIDDPYADGYEAGERGISLTDALKDCMLHRKHSRKATKNEYKKLIKNGWKDANDLHN